MRQVLLMDTLVLTLNSPDGQEGYPGNLDVQVTYRLEAHSLTIRYRAVCDLDTPCNLTNHTYFNLGGPSLRTSNVTGHTAFRGLLYPHG